MLRLNSIIKERGKGVMKIIDYKILIVEDERELLHLIEKVLRKDGFHRVYLAETYQEAIWQIQNHQPDCCILDVMLPDGDGFSLLKKIRQTSQIPVLFLSARGEEEDRILGLGLGADDYIVKPFVPKELLLRVRAVLSRVYQRFSVEDERKPIFQLGRTIIDFNQGMVKRPEGEILLTAKEYQLLLKLYENHNRIVTYDSLCQATWGDGYFGYENTLMVHIRRLREKLEKDPSHPEFLITIRGLGYQLKVEEE